MVSEDLILKERKSFSIDSNKMDIEAYKILYNSKIQDIANDYFNKFKFSALEICALIKTYVARITNVNLASYDAKTTFVSENQTWQDSPEMSDALFVFECDNNDAAQYLENCLPIIGIWASKGSGKQSEEGSRYVYVKLKSKEELSLQNKVNQLSFRIDELGAFNRLR